MCVYVHVLYMIQSISVRFGHIWCIVLVHIVCVFGAYANSGLVYIGCACIVRVLHMCAYSIFRGVLSLLLVFTMSAICRHMCGQSMAQYLVAPGRAAFRSMD